MTSTNCKQRRQKTLSFRCSEGEYQKIGRMARQSGKNLSRYMAAKLLKNEVDNTELCMLLRTVAESYYKLTGDRQYQVRVEKILDREGL